MHVISAEYSESPTGLASHFHDCHQLLYVAEGSIRAVIGGRPYRLDSGGLLIMSRLEEHSVHVYSSKYRRYHLLISDDSSNVLYDDYQLSSVLVNRANGFCHAVTPEQCGDIFETLLKQILSEYVQQKPWCGDMMDMALRQLLIQLYRCKPELFVCESNHHIAVAKAIQRYLEQNYREQLSLSELAGEYHLSTSCLSHLYKKVTGYAPMQYLQACRILAAKRYLSSTDLPVKDIVARCGFSDDSNFSRKFRENTGKSPSEFRAECRAPGTARTP